MLLGRDAEQELCANDILKARARLPNLSSQYADEKIVSIGLERIGLDTAENEPSEVSLTQGS